MKKFFTFIVAIALCSTMAMAATPKRLASVLEVRDGVIPTDPNELLMMSKRFFYNAQGELCKICEGNKTTTLEHDAADPKKMTMTVDDTGNGILRRYDIILDDAGNAVAATCDSEGWKCEAVYEYADGYLAFMDKTTTESDRSVSGTARFEYAGGNLSDLHWTHAEESTDYTDQVNFSYSGIANTGRLHMFYTILVADIDEIEYLGQAGRLGGTSMELPSNVDMMLADGVAADGADGSDGGSADNLEWTFDDNGYPVRLNYIWNKDVFRVFTWEDDPTLGVASTAAGGSECCYTLQGVRVDRPGKGIYIVRRADGSSRLVIGK